MSTTPQEPKRTSRLQLLTAGMLSIFGMLLLIVGISVPPHGVIDTSVLIAYGEIMTFAGALFGIDYHYRR